MTFSRQFESERRKRKLLNIVELGDGEQIYIRLARGALFSDIIALVIELILRFALIKNFFDCRWLKALVIFAVLAEA